MIAVASMAAMEHVGDPLADDTVSRLVGERPLPSSTLTMDGPNATARLNEATRLMAGWTHNGTLLKWPAVRPVSSPGEEASVTEVLHDYLQSAAHLPHWADATKVARAENLFMSHGAMSCTLLFCASLPECYVLPQLAGVLHIAGQLEAHTEHRIRQTAAMVFPVMMRGGLMSPGGTGVAQVLKVRLIHATIRHLILRGNPAQVRGLVPRRQMGEPAGMHQAMSDHGWDVDAQGVPCNQIELAYTLLTFSYVFLNGMRKLGQRLSHEDEEAYLHAWNVVGHVLGIRSEWMAHTMEEAATLFDRIQARARTVVVTPDARPALGRALMNTMANSIHVPVLRHVPVPLTQWLIGRQTARDIGVDEHVPLLSRLLFRLGLVLVRAVDAVVRLISSRFSIVRLFTRTIGYHMLTRFLLDQTRPLTLPDQVLNPMMDTVAEWSDDPKASAWINRLEDRLTTAGTWRPSAAKQQQNQRA
ncbi:hypothetical protein J2W49_001829 [Hydrogenophaga palleronii]|uniref:ER-bound oxygenase mpaB/mpaB'/Rubber oxygenase catalytic domain-containing protein n=1 Tax=Hydrogenophaga palleronii TaxID=65655 RepID=A0ABU1WLF7_9BURK|nr:oxygenase MpaB family protein [Hydrogenophaga palleronii]MDR7149874.1 hypothetical protein [Hydrogenophaga palleronii]